MIDIIIISLIALMLASAMTYIVKNKKQGGKCIGCPSAGCCSAVKEKPRKCSPAGCNCRGNK